ncbi:MAG: sigma-70 family RNA polymerase sigma factor [Desulfobacteraceae bacterium]|nr:sigma-70 family RNA polymerase sigma factor [Desulfobacteraceae bacterium]
MEVIKLHDKYYEKIRKFIVALIRDEWTADDLVQETFIKVDKNLSKVKDKSRLSSWIYKIAYNLCMDYLRNNQTVLFKKTEQVTSQMTHIEIGKNMERHQMGSCVRDKIEMLPDKLRSVLLLFDLEEFSHNEISQILDISCENAKTRLHRARKMLKEILERECSFEKDERDVLVCIPKKDTI